MKELYFVTGNRIKLKEANLVLKKQGIKLKMKNLDIHEPDLESIEKVAHHKAKEAFRKLKKPLVTEDTGIFFIAYDNFPGLFAKRVFLALGLEGLLLMVKGKSRKAHFGAAVGYADAKGKIRIFSGRLNGSLTTKVRRPKAKVLAYDKIFVPKGKRKTIVEMPLSEKNEISHRAKAFEKFAGWLNSHS